MESKGLFGENIINIKQFKDNGKLYREMDVVVPSSMNPDDEYYLRWIRNQSVEFEGVLVVTDHDGNRDKFERVHIL